MVSSNEWDAVGPKDATIIALSMQVSKLQKSKRATQYKHDSQNDFRIISEWRENKTELHLKRDGLNC